MTEKQALAKHEKVMVGVKHYSSIANGYAMGYSSGDPDDGFVKVMADEDMKILGAHVIGPQAAILVQAFVYLMNMDFCCSCGKTKRAEPLLEVAQDCHVSGSANLMNRSMVIHPALSEVAGWIVDELEWVTANVSVPISVPGTETIL
jgi:dihydrolipoamide dehydrogenase